MYFFSHCTNPAQQGYFRMTIHIVPDMMNEHEGMLLIVTTNQRSLWIRSLWIRAWLNAMKCKWKFSQVIRKLENNNLTTLWIFQPDVCVCHLPYVKEICQMTRLWVCLWHQTPCAILDQLICGYPTILPKPDLLHTAFKSLVLHCLASRDPIKS